MPDLLNVSIPGNLRALGNYRVSLYSPTPLSAVSADFEAADEGLQPSPAWTNVPAFYEPTPEFTNVTAIGLTKEENVFTSDKWWFLADQELDDGWMIVMTYYRNRSMRGVNIKHPLLNRCWITQGNTEIIAEVGRSWTYAKLSPTNIIPV